MDRPIGKTKSSKKSSRSKSIRRNSRSILSPIDFNSDTVSSSSPIAPDSVIKTKTHRKKIRSTQDFNQLNVSFTSQESDVSIKSDTRKTKKTKNRYALPKITNLLEDPLIRNENNSLDIFMESKSTRKRTRRKRENCSPKVAKGRHSTERGVLRVSNNGSIKKKVKKLKNKKSDTSEESQDLNNVSSENEECEIKIKNKKKVVSDSIYGQMLTSQLINKPANYEKRLRKILLDDCVPVVKNTENDKSLNKRESLRKVSEDKLIRKSKSSINDNILQEAIEFNSRCNSLDKCSLDSSTNKKGKKRYSSYTNDIEETGKYVRCRDPKEKPKRNGSLNNISKLSDKQFNTTEVLNSEGHSRATFVLDHKKTKRLDTESNISLVLNVDDGNISDDVFNVENQKDKNQLEPVSTISFILNVDDGNVPDDGMVLNVERNKWPDKLINIDRSNMNNSTEGQLRKSVQFADALFKEDNARRSTFLIDKCRRSIPLFKEKSVEFIADEVNVSNSLHFEDSNKTDSEKHSKEKSSLSDKSRKSNTAPIYKQFSTGQTDLNNELFKINLPSPILDSNMRYFTSGVTPAVNEISANISRDASVYLNNRENENNISNNSQLTRCSPSIIDLTTPYEKKMYKQSDITLSNKSPCNKSVYSNSVKKLHRESTFLKDNVIANGENLNITFDNDLCKSNNYSQNTEVSRKNSSLDNEKSTLTLTMPVRKKMRKNSDVVADRSSLEKSVCIKPSDNIFTGITPRDNHLDVFNESEKTSTTPKLNRTATFIKDDINYNSPMANNSTTKLIDTSKVTKRKQWDKSRLSMSFLNGSIDIGNVSAPWKEDTLNDTFQVSYRDQSVVLNDLPSGKKRNVSYGAPPSSTSTPLPAFKTDLRKKVLSKGKNVTINKSKNVTKAFGKSESKPVVKARTKMPNFALIHQRAYDKLESLKEMSERKAQRAKLLLSGCKPEVSGSLNTSSKSKKFLQFNPVEHTKMSPIIKKSNESGKKLLLNSSIVSITKVKNISPSQSNPNIAVNKLTSIEKKKELFKTKASRIPTKINNMAPEKKGVTKYGFKMASMDVKNITREEQLKAVATKTRIVKNTIEGRRNVIQGVRSNRRFELLMSLRKK